MTVWKPILGDWTDTGSTCGREVVTASGGRNTECPPPVVSHPESVGLETMLRSFLSGQQQQRQQHRQQQRQPPRQRPVRRDWNGVMCFSCGKSGHAATRCPKLDEGFPFMLPACREDSGGGGGGLL